MAKLLADQHREVEAQMALANALGVKSDSVSMSETERTHRKTLQLGSLSIEWDDEGQEQFYALVDVVKLGVEAKKKPQPTVVPGGTQKTA